MRTGFRSIKAFAMTRQTSARQCSALPVSYRRQACGPHPRINETHQNYLKEDMRLKPVLCATLTTAGLIAAALGITLTPSFAAQSACEGVKVEMTKARKAEYAPLVVSAMEAKIKPSQVEFNTIMESGNWSAAYVSTPVSDDGVMFFQTVGGKKRFREVWGGWADPSERPELVAWARKLGAPADLARCFAETVTVDE